MSDTPFRPLDAVDDWAAARDASSSAPVVIFKHSSMCPTSARANEEMQTLAEGDIPVYRVVVQEAREVSDAIASELDIQHETPQVIVLSDGSPVFDTSHHRVKEDAVREAMPA
jgi:bacillithiol system protein YtxJ